MSSYHSNFSYLNKNSKDDLRWLIVHFEADQGETDSFLSQEQVYADSYNGRKRMLYGTKWTEVANVKITVIKQDGSNFSVTECREAYKWLTGNPVASWLDLYVDDQLQYSFLGTVQNVTPQKLDARTVGLNIYFESVSPWAYSAPQNLQCSFGQSLYVDKNGVVSKGNGSKLLNVEENGVLYNGTEGGVGLFDITPGGVVHIDNSVHLQIDNKSDDLYSYINLETTFTNISGDYLSINNITIGEETLITELNDGETITISAGQFILSDKPNKTFGNSFNFIWPRLAPGINEFIIGGSGVGVVDFTYRYPMKIGDCAIDIYTQNDCFDCSDNTSYGTISWDDIVNTPTTLGGYGITNVYTESEIDEKLNNLNTECDATVDEKELAAMLGEVLGK